MTSNLPTCWIDLYVDKNIVTRPDGSRRLMHCSFYADQRNKNAFNLSPNQEILFTLYDVGSDKFDWADATGMALTLGFNSAEEGQSTPSPLDETTKALQCATNGNGKSPPFGKDLLNRGAYPKISTYEPGVTPNGNSNLAYLQLKHTGQFEYSATFQFTVSNVSYTYSFDPEMIVRG